MKPSITSLYLVTLKFLSPDTNKHLKARLKRKLFFGLILSAFQLILLLNQQAQGEKPWELPTSIYYSLSSYVQEPNLLYPNSRWFGYDNGPGIIGPSKGFLNNPGVIVNLVPGGGDFFAGASWVPGNPGRWYVCTYGTRVLLWCDTVTGTRNTIGPLGAISGSPVGLPYDPVSDFLFLITSSPNNLYLVNRTTGAATLRAPITGVFTLIVEGAFSNAGQLYGIELTGAGNLGKINKYTGVWTTVGPLGATHPLLMGVILTEVRVYFTGQQVEH